MVRAVPIVHNNNNAMSSDESDDGIQDPLVCNAPIIATGEEEVDENNNDYDANYYNGPFLGQQNNHPRTPSSSLFKKRHSSRKSSLKSNTTSPNGRSGLSPSSSSSRTRPVVKLLINSVSHTYSEPWRRQPQRESSGTGFLIRWAENVDATDADNKNNSFQQTTASGARYKPSLRILTNAHVVRNASTVRARASFGPHVVSCEVEWLSLPLDLALLKIAEGDWMDFCLGWNFDVANAGGEYYIDRSSSNALAAGDDVNASLNATLTRKSNNNNNNNKKSNTPSSPPLTCLALSSLNLPKLDENVTCVGFPQGGTQISVTRGVVSRIDVNSQYVLRIQIDAAINAGNSGGPVFDEEGWVVGIASSHLRGAGNIGYIIPGKIVAMFLSMCRDGMNASVEERFSGLGSLVERGNSNPSQEDGDGMDGSEMEQYPKHVPGIPELAIHGAQTLESKALRRSLGLDLLGIPGGIRIIGVRGSKLHGGGEEGGKDCSEGVCNAKKRKYGDDDGDGAIMDEPNNDAVVVRDKHKTNNGVDTTTNEECNKQTTKDQLQANDVLLSINRIPIGMDGTIQLSPTRPDERINFRSVVTCQRVGSEVELDVLRDRRIKKMKVVLDTSRFLVPQYDGFDACPLYVVCGGCVFSPLSLPLVSDKSSKRKNPSSTFSRYFQDRREGNEQILILSKVLADEVNVGYHGWSNLILKSVNGHEPKNIQELVDVIVRKVQGEMIEFRCQTVGLDEADFVICMNMLDVLKTEQRILNRHMIASWCSTDALSPGLRQYVKMCMFTEADTTACCITLSGLRSNSALDWRQFQAAHGNVASRAMKRGKDGVPYTLGDKAVQEQTMTK